MSDTDRTTPADLSRRAFLRSSAGIAGGSLLAFQLPVFLAVAQAAAAARDAGAAFLYLQPAEAAVLDAIAARIIPSDDSPGAREAGVIHFIDQALGSFMADARADLAAGAAMLDTRAAAVAEGEGFAGLDPERQDALLGEIDTTPFFELMHYLTVAGMFSLPSYGGNRDHAGWKLLGFTHQHVWAPPFGFYDAELLGKPFSATDTAGDHDHG
jgi:gluconate 2-dehydrogenase gamma chain